MWRGRPSIQAPPLGLTPSPTEGFPCPHPPLHKSAVSSHPCTVLAGGHGRGGLAAWVLQKRVSVVPKTPLID